jgi:hypothetical protein
LKKLDFNSYNLNNLIDIKSKIQYRFQTIGNVIGTLDQRRMKCFGICKHGQRLSFLFVDKAVVQFSRIVWILDLPLRTMECVLHEMQDNLMTSLNPRIMHLRLKR